MLVKRLTVQKTYKLELKISTRYSLINLELEIANILSVKVKLLIDENII